MKCKHCKAEMEEMCKTTGWIQNHVHWCPECGSILKILHGVTAETFWYKPGYLIELEGI